MEEYINRAAVREALYDADAITIKGVKILNQFPAADVAPVLRGRWLATDEWMTDECSNCGARINIEEFDECSYHPKEGNVRLNYCPNCGAKMDGGEDNAAD